MLTKFNCNCTVFVLFYRVFRNFGEGRYVGDEAAEWISNYLDKPGCKIYQLTKPRTIQEDEKWGDTAQPGDKVMQNKAELQNLKTCIALRLLLANTCKKLSR